MEQIWEREHMGQTRYGGLHLPGLMGGAIRPLMTMSDPDKENLFADQDPVAMLRTKFKAIYSASPTTATLFWAAIGDLEVKEEILHAEFQIRGLLLASHSLSATLCCRSRSFDLEVPF